MSTRRFVEGEVLHHQRRLDRVLARGHRREAQALKRDHPRHIEERIEVYQNSNISKRLMTAVSSGSAGSDRGYRTGHTG